MISDRVKRNIWLTLSIVSILIIIDRAIRILMGELDWWQLVSAIVISFFCVKFYLCYRKKVQDNPSN